MIRMSTSKLSSTQQNTMFLLWTMANHGTAPETYLNHRKVPNIQNGSTKQLVTSSHVTIDFLLLYKISRLYRDLDCLLFYRIHHKLSAQGEALWMILSWQILPIARF